MKCCQCTNIYNHCTPVSVCDPVGLLSLFGELPDDTYRMQYDFGQVSAFADLVISDEGAQLTGYAFNEFYTYTAKLYDADMTPVTLTVNEVEYDCFQFQTTPL